MSQGKKNSNGRLLCSCLVYSTFLVKFVWTFGDYRKTQNYALVSEVAWPILVSSNPRQKMTMPLKSRDKELWRRIRRNIWRRVQDTCAVFFSLSEAEGHPVSDQEKNVITVPAWNTLKFNLWELMMSLEVIGRKVLSANTKYYPSGRQHHCNNRERDSLNIMWFSSGITSHLQSITCCINTSLQR